MSPSESESYATANLWRRLAALIYDAFLLFAITLAYFSLLTLLKAILISTQPIEDFQPGLLLQCIMMLGWLAALIGYYYISWRKQGQPLGMKSWRLKLQQADGSLATPEQCIKRSLLASLSLAIGGMGYLWCLVPPAKACLHDIYSATEVVVLPKTK